MKARTIAMILMLIGFFILYHNVSHTVYWAIVTLELAQAIMIDKALKLAKIPGPPGPQGPMGASAQIYNNTRNNY